MTPTLHMTRQDDTYMLDHKGLRLLTGVDEYGVEVINYLLGERFTRLVAPFLTLKGLPMWADTTTGTVYNAAGKAQAPLKFDSQPVLTGRQVPDTKVRNSEAQLRFLKSLLREVGDEDDE